MIKISNEVKTPIYVQIAKQFKDSIGTGELKEGNPLPRRQVLARQLGVNINTINHSYRILENEGYIYSRRGIGSFVNPRIDHKTKNELAEEIRRQLKSLKRMTLTRGWTLEEFRTFVLDLLRMEDEPLQPRAVFVECHEAWTDHLAFKLQDELGIEVKPVVLPDRKTDLGEAIRAIKEADFVITTHVHFEEVREIVGEGKFVFPLDMHLSYELMTELRKIKESKIGVPFLKTVTIKRLNHWIKAVGFKTDLIPVPYQDAEELIKRGRKFKTLMVTENHVEELRKLFSEKIRILTIESVLGEQSVQRLKENLSKSYSVSGLNRQGTSP
jgi:GntR family transcriptional regulator